MEGACESGLLVLALRNSAGTEKWRDRQMEQPLSPSGHGFRVEKVRKRKSHTEKGVHIYIYMYNYLDQNWIKDIHQSGAVTISNCQKVV